LQNILISLDAQSSSNSSSSGSGSVGVDAALLAGRALYVNALTMQEPHWQGWTQHNDNSLAAPEVCLPTVF
jgi:hypothetical protein